MKRKVLPQFLLKLFLIFYFKIKYLKTSEEQNENEDSNLLLTDKHSIPYLSLDQCMLRPGQHEHLSYSLTFRRRNKFLCDKLIICYPSQLSGQNTLNGTIMSIPYRLRDSRRNLITKQCENERKNLMKNKTHSDLISIPWHGILINTKIKNGVFLTKISLSITNKTYLINNTEVFEIQFGNKSNIFTTIIAHRYIPVSEQKMIADYEEIPYSDDINLRKEYLSKIDKGAYLHKYAGLWALGLDLLPSSPQRLLHLFVYRGCACGIDAFFSTPTTKKFNMILPKRPKFDEFNEKDCTKEFANNTLISLGDISKLKFGLIISLKLWTGINGNNGKIEFLNGIDGKVEFGIYFDNNGIKSIPVMNDKGLNKTMENLMVSGVEISMTITLAKYFLWVTIQIKRKLIFSSFWPDNWWEGNFFEGVDDVHMRIDGDFFVTSHPNLKKMTKQKIKNKYDEAIRLPENGFISKSQVTTFKFYCIVEGSDNFFEINLMHNFDKFNKYVGFTFLSLRVDLNENKIKFSSKNTPLKYFDNNNLFKRGSAFEYTITLQTYGFDRTLIEITVNNIKLISDWMNIILNLPMWSVDRISLEGSFLLFNYKTFEYYKYKRPNIKHKRKLDEIKSYGNIICFEAFVPKAKEMSERKWFEVNLLNEASEFSKITGDTVLQLKFTFDPDNYTNLGQNVSYIEGNSSNSLLILSSYIYNQKEWGKEEKHQNPIGQTGVPIIINIYADKYFYNISINEGVDPIHYSHRLPPWATNWIMITGDIIDVVFEEKSKKCQNITKNYQKFELPKNILRINKQLKIGNTIIIEGVIPKSFDVITINFLHGALEKHAQVGITVFQLNITKIDVTGSYFAKGKWGNSEGYRNNLKDLVEGEKIRISIQITKVVRKDDYGVISSNEIYIFEMERQEKYSKGKEIIPLEFAQIIPASATEYISVIGLDLEGNGFIKIE